jgi:subtilisin family serine protease
VLRAAIAAWPRIAERRGTRSSNEPRVPDDFAWLGPRIHGDLVWLVRVVGGIAMLHREVPGGARAAERKTLEAWEASLEDTDQVIAAFLELLAGLQAPGEVEHLWAVHRNRQLELAIRESTATVKVDAARHVFDVTGRGIRWAVIDTGIDARHVAFRRRRQDGSIWSADPFQPVAARGGHPKERPPKQLTRIVGTYDFTTLRALMAAPLDDLEAYLEQLPGPQQDRLRDLLASDRVRGQLAEAQRRSAEQFVEIDAEHARISAQGRSVDWQAWEPLLLVPQTSELAYKAPFSHHGTHVAGILGADWRPEDLTDDLVQDNVRTPRRLVERTGMCPEIELYDIRVIDTDGAPDEFALIAALQFVRALNSYHDHLTIHGVNLSLSIPHDVSNYACGRTPVCEESDRLVASGVVVVAAAGNHGRARYVTTDGKIDEGYRTVSITDPGNAESVITVGATHRAEPHAFGVSYFSSRGPTGDGRFKPDLVAPGEKVTSTVMVNDSPSEESMDGTSMAAPHVSGAAALLLCRYPELIGKPADIKRILCKSATDLGRDRYFQGAGLLDTFRALQSF